jgi:hypothetical protein
MKINIGGSISMKIMPQAYEPIEASSTFMVEHEINDEWMTTEKAGNEIEKLNEKVNKILKAQVEQKMEVILKSYKEFKNKIKEIMNS